MIVRAKAPLRISFAGGGTDVSPYSDKFGGCVLNAAINMYTYCTIEETNNNNITFFSRDLKDLKINLFIKEFLILFLFCRSERQGCKIPSNGGYRWSDMQFGTTDQSDTSAVTG